MPYLPSDACVATNEAPHSRLFKGELHFGLGWSLVMWLGFGNTSFLGKHVRDNEDPVVWPAIICEVVSLHYARIAFPGGGVDTVSTKDLAPGCSEMAEVIQAQAKKGIARKPNATTLVSHQIPPTSWILT